MKKILLLAALLATISVSAFSQTVGPGPVPSASAPCTAFGTTAGTCIQGAGALGTPSSGVGTNITNVNAALLSGNPIGTSSGTVPLLNAANTWSNLQTYSSGGRVQLGTVASTSPFTVAGAMQTATGSGSAVRCGTNAGYPACSFDQENGSNTGSVFELDVVDGSVRWVADNTSVVLSMDMTGTYAITIAAPPGASAGDIPLCKSTTNVIHSAAVTCGTSVLAAKKNVESLRSFLARTKNLTCSDYLARMQPVAFDWRYNNAKDIGFIADWMEKIDPLLATYEGDKITNVKDRAILAVATCALQETNEKVSARGWEMWALAVGVFLSLLAAGVAGLLVYKRNTGGMR